MFENNREYHFFYFYVNIYTYLLLLCFDLTKVKFVYGYQKAVSPSHTQYKYVWKKEQHGRVVEGGVSPFRKQGGSLLCFLLLFQPLMKEYPTGGSRNCSSDQKLSAHFFKPFFISPLSRIHTRIVVIKWRSS